jgi:glycerophosphoryl diester phosphodiesterase
VPIYQRAVHVVAHRGASDDAPEHTLAAYRKAIEDGADAVECDVRLTRDGHLVCVHDSRVDRTSDGRGRVSTLELTDLAELDFAAWRRGRREVPAWRRDAGARHRPDQPERDESGVLTLDRLLELVTDCGRRVELAVETKHPSRYAGLVERTLVDALDRFGLTTPVDGAPLVRWWLPPGLRDGRLPPQVDIAGPALPVLRRFPRYVERAHAAGYPVHVWTVNTTADLEFVLRLGVDAVITDRPRWALERAERAA